MLQKVTIFIKIAPIYCSLLSLMAQILLPQVLYQNFFEAIISFIDKGFVV
jgi:hypothetical protein